MQQILEQIKNLLCFNPYCGWLITLGISLLVSFLVLLICKFIAEKIQKIKHASFLFWNTVFTVLLENLKFFVLFFWFFILCSKFLTLPPFSERIIQFILVFVTTYQIGLWGLCLLKTWNTKILLKKSIKDPQSSAALGLLYRFVQTAFLILVALLALSNLDINIGALLAGLGIGGIAVALAAQNVLVDLLASLSIILDKPFCVGDLIYTGNDKGVVEQIGIKTTRLRSISGEELIISNKNILDSRIQNFKRMTQRRVTQKFTVLSTTNMTVLKNIPIWIKAIIAKKSSLKFDHCNLITLGDFGLTFELVFFVLDADSVVCLNAQEDVLLEMLEKFRSEKISLAFPTQTIHLETTESKI